MVKCRPRTPPPDYAFRPLLHSTASRRGEGSGCPERRRRGSPQRCHGKRRILPLSVCRSRRTPGGPSHRGDRTTPGCPRPARPSRRPSARTRGQEGRVHPNLAHRCPGS
ncbi:unnamed protein product [Ectocarpus fasciculatus]